MDTHVVGRNKKHVRLESKLQPHPWAEDLCGVGAQGQSLSSDAGWGKHQDYLEQSSGRKYDNTDTDNIKQMKFEMDLRVTSRNLDHREVYI